MPRVRVTRRIPFAAGHRLSSPQLDEEGNRRVFGPCYRLHGHNYDLEVTVEGEVDPSTGFVIELGELKRRIGELVVDEGEPTEAKPGEVLSRPGKGRGTTSQ